MVIDAWSVAESWLWRPRPVAAWALVVGWLAVFNGLRHAFWRLSAAMLPGTLAHELCHFVVGTLTLARPISLSVWPHRDGRTWMLGSVQYANLRAWNAAPAALAPLLLVPIGAWSFDHIVVVEWTSGRWILAVGGAWAAANCWQSSWPSRTDWVIALRSLPCWGVVAAAWWLLPEHVLHIGMAWVTPLVRAAGELVRAGTWS